MKRFVYVSSIGAPPRRLKEMFQAPVCRGGRERELLPGCNSSGADDPLFPLNLAWGVLFWKKRAEEEIQRSGMEYTIVRPGCQGPLHSPLLFHDPWSRPELLCPQVAFSMRQGVTQPVRLS